MLRPKRENRLSVDEVLDRVRSMITQLGGSWQTKVFRDFVDPDDGVYDDEEAGGIALLGRHRSHG